MIDDNHARVQKMTSVRAPAVAGSFYPGNPSELSSTLNHLIDRAQTTQTTCENMQLICCARAFIIPHAGYQYSGETAASAYAMIKANKNQFKKALIIGPCHRVWIESIALPRSDYFATPLGNIKLDKKTIEAIGHLGVATYSDTAHQEEHSIEVHLPFLQACLNDDIEIIPVAVGQASYADVAKIIEMLWDKKNCLMIISSDLSHFHHYDEANAIDEKTNQLIQSLNYKRLNQQMACGCTGIQALLKVAKAKSLSARLIKHCNSGDIYGDKSRVVGYGSYAIV